MKKLQLSLAAALLASSLFVAGSASAHCDTLDGPVVIDAKKALESRKIEPVLIWVQKRDEAEIKAAFHQTLEVRKLGAEAKRLADTYFFETLVRVHRAGEGAPYTGLKPAGLDQGPAIPAADKSLDTGTLTPVQEVIRGTLHPELNRRFDHALALRKAAKPGDVEAGRKAVAAYVEYFHYVEGLYAAAKGPAHGHGAAEGAAAEAKPAAGGCPHAAKAAAAAAAPAVPPAAEHHHGH